MSSFFGFEITQDKPALVKADPVAEINLTMACAVDGNKRSVVSVRPDDGDTFTLAVLSPGVSDFQKIDLKLTAGNEALEFSTSGATVHVTGYVTLPPEYMLDSDSDSDHEAETSTELARTRHGTARLVENVDSDSDDESFNPDLMFAESSDEDGPDDNEFGVQPLLKRAVDEGFCVFAALPPDTLSKPTPASIDARAYAVLNHLSRSSRLKGKRNGHNITRAHLAKLGADLLDVRGPARRVRTEEAVVR